MPTLNTLVMRTIIKCTLIILSLFGISCSSPNFLPDPSELAENGYGAHITLKKQSNEIIEGELISINKDSIVVLDDDKLICTVCFVNDVKKFHLQYAKADGYPALLPISILAIPAHGLFSIISLPINAITLISILSSDDLDYEIKGKRISVERLQKFARFPQGLPPNITISMIKRIPGLDE